MKSSFLSLLFLAALAVPVMAQSSSSTGGMMMMSSSSSSSGSATIPGSASSTGSGGGSVTFCEKYTRLLNDGDNSAANQQALVTSVVARAVLGNTTASNPAVPGMVLIGSPIRQFFDGSNQFKPNPTNYIQSFADHGLNTSFPFGQLAVKLITFIGAGLGCQAAGFPAYTGNVNMSEVHVGMSINLAQATYFGNQVALSMLSYGVIEEDVKNIAVPYLQQFFRYPSMHDGTIFPRGSYGAGQMAGAPITTLEICSAADCPVAPPAYSFCEKYTAATFGNVNATNEFKLIGMVVARAALGGQGNGQQVQGIVGTGSPLIAFFNGSIAFRESGRTPNFIQSFAQNGTDPNGDFGRLALHLTQFFGFALGCRDAAFPGYQGDTDMRRVHRKMPINNAQNQYFIQQVANSAISFGVAPTDVALVGQTLKAFDRGNNANEICNQRDCPCQPGIIADANGNCGAGPPGNDGSSASMVNPSIAAMVATAVAAVVASVL